MFLHAPGIEIKHPVSKAVARVTMAVPLILKLLDLQKVIIPEVERSTIKSQLEDIRGLDMLMISRLTATTNNMDNLTKGRDAIKEIKSNLLKLVDILPNQDAKLTPKGLIHDAIANDINWALKQFDKKINELVEENPALASSESHPNLTHRLH
jgi:hypothetical protein